MNSNHTHVAIKWFLKAMKLNHLDAGYFVGLLLEQARGDEERLKKIIKIIFFIIVCFLYVLPFEPRSGPNQSSWTCENSSLDLRCSGGANSQRRERNRTTV